MNASTVSEVTARRARGFALWVGVGVACLAAAVLVAWVLGLELVKSMLPGFPSMKANTALCLGLLGVSVARASRAEPPAAGWRLLPGIAGSIALLSVLEYAFELDLGIDQFLFADEASAVINPYPGRMAASTALNILALASALLLLEAGGSGRILQQLAAMIPVFLGLIIGVGKLYGAHFEVGIERAFASMALHTAACLSLLGMAVLAADPQRGLLRIILADREGGQLARTVLPVGFALPAIVLGLTELGRRAGLYDVDFTSLVFLLTAVCVVSAVTVIAAERLNQSEDLLRASNASLDSRVRSRTAELEAAVSRLTTEAARREAADAGRVQAELALRRSEELFRRTFDQGPIGAAMVALDFRFMRVNDALCRITGYSKEELTALTFPEITHADDIAADVEQAKRLAAGEIAEYSMDKRYIRKDGCIAWVSLSVRSVRDEAGRAMYYVPMMQDITNRILAEQKLQESNAFVTGVLDSLSASVAVLDARGLIVAVNETWRRFAEARGATSRPFVDAGVDYFDAVEAGIRRPGDQGTQEALAGIRCVLEGRQPQFSIEYPCDTPLGREWFVMRVTPLRGPRGGAVVAHQEITERKRLEVDLREKNAALEHFTYTISHDLKSPLVTVKTFLGYLDQDLARGNAERVGQDMDFIRAAADKMGRLLTELLHFSRVGRFDNPPTNTSFRELVAEVLALTAGALAARGVQPEISGENVALTGDRSRLVEIWQNLVENAIKFMGDQTAPRVAIGVERTDGEAVFFVRDNGIGIDPRYQHKVFGLFERLDPSVEGTGIGLAMAKRIIERYGGRIWLESEGAGRGSCFRFTLPEALAHEEGGVSS